MVDKRLAKQIEVETIYEILDELSYYQLLGLAQDTQQSEVETGFRTQSRGLHPDKIRGDANLTRKVTRIYRLINEAYRVLKDPETRAAYDAELTLGTNRLSDGGRADAKASSDANKDPALAARTEKGGKFWRLALQAWRDENYQGCVMNIQFAMNFERDNEVMKDWLQKAQKAAKAQASKKEKNPYKLRF
ncbi:MAG: DnaJ domain-containing protein [Proteobacteria bacterium]|nr:DnaJ domain-containing protein [Pseudomonadota bacterium]MCP4921284.1 DnaJ domain-containing protein [Pseudomonadota bacterium]